MNTDKIREAIKEKLKDVDSCDGIRSRFSFLEIETILEIITPYLAHGITEAEVAKLADWCDNHSGKVDLENETGWRGWITHGLRTLGLITSRESIAESVKIRSYELVNEQAKQSEVKCNPEKAKSPESYRPDLSMACKYPEKEHDITPEEVKSKIDRLVKEIDNAEPEHIIHTLAADQKDLDPRIPPMVNEKVWELVGDKPEAKPGAIKRHQAYTYDGAPSHIYCYAKDVDRLEAELAQLQAERDMWKSMAEDKTKLSDDLVYARLRQVPKESEALVKAREAYRKNLRCLSEVNNREYVLMSYIRELEAWKKQVEERT